MSAQDLLRTILDEPFEMSWRLILGDYLEEQDDPRCHLVRLVPELLNIPGDIHPDWHGPLRLQEVLDSWGITCCRIHFLGRLLGIAHLWHFLEVWHPELSGLANLPPFDEIAKYVAICELYSCGLIPPPEPACDPWYVLHYSRSSNPLSARLWLGLAIGIARSGRFGSSQAIAGCLWTTSLYLNSRSTTRMSHWSPPHHMRDKFLRIAPYKMLGPQFWKDCAALDERENLREQFRKRLSGPR